MVTVLVLRAPRAAERMTMLPQAMLLMLASPGIFFGSAIVVRSAYSARRVMQRLPLTVDALAARLVALALTPAAIVVLVIVIAYGVQPVSGDTAVRVLFFPIVLLMFSAQAFCAVAVVRGSLMPFLPMIAVLAPYALLPFAINPQRFVLPPSVETALAPGAPTWTALAAVAALALIAAAYQRTRRALRDRDLPRGGTMIAMLGGGR
jgi:hypothetical protein